MPKLKSARRPDTEIRRIVHHYFHKRYRNGRGERGKHGISTTISVIRSELKASHSLSQSEIAAALIYLIDQGWIKKDEINRSFASKTGANYSSGVTYYRITADGVDKIEGESEYTMPRFHGVNINATGQNIITLGDNNQVDAKFEAIAKKLIALKDSVRGAADITDSDKVSIIADVDSIESQLAKSEPNRAVVRAIWSTIERITTATSLAANVAAITPILMPLLG